MGQFTNIGLVKFAQKIASEANWCYLMGSIGNYLTDDFFAQKRKLNQHKWYTASKNAAIEAVLADSKAKGVTYRCVDCVGMIKCYYWNDYRQGNASGYKTSSDVSANYMYNMATEKGPINTIPEIPGLAVWLDGHIGVYCGNGLVVESTPNTTFSKRPHGLGGPCVTKLSERPWTHWLKIPFIEYIETDAKEMAGSAPVTWRNPINFNGATEFPSGKFVLTADGVRWSYRLENGDYPVACWFKTPSGSWFHFDDAGYMQTGWFQDNDRVWYYLNPEKGDNEGIMVTGLRIIDGVPYYFKSNGAMAQNENVTLNVSEKGVLY